MKWDMRWRLGRGVGVIVGGGKVGGLQYQRGLLEQKDLQRQTRTWCTPVTCTESTEMVMLIKPTC